MQPSTAAAAAVAIVGPLGSGEFGRTVTVLPNGNLIVTDSGYDLPGSVLNVGAVYVYNGATLAQISVLTGSSSQDSVGSGGVVVLANGNFVVSSPSWHNGAAASAGAVTWGSAVSGVSGRVGPDNSLVGSSTNDIVGLTKDFYGEELGVVALPNGNYVVSSTEWDNGAATDAGAVTWGSGTSGVAGVVSPANSLVGSSASDEIGMVKVLANGNYVVCGPRWDNRGAVDAGAVTWGSGTAGIAGFVSPENSLVGATSDDWVGVVTVLPNGNYVVSSPEWDYGGAVDAGAVTWGNGTAGVIGSIGPANSLVGSSDNDRVGSGSVVVLANGNYVISSPEWHNGAAANAGAVTWASGVSGRSGILSASNSLVGQSSSSNFGLGSVVPLPNGHYVVISPHWGWGDALDAGAATWGNGVTGTSGVVGPYNSLLGSHPGDSVGSGGISVLANGNYVVSSPLWANGSAIAAGAVTWGSSLTGVSGVVSPVNSLVGSSVEDRVGASGVTVLPNGNYVVSSPYWHNGSGAGGAVTWGNGDSGITGPIGPANSLVGGTGGDMVGSGGVTVLANGNYVVRSSLWTNTVTAQPGPMSTAAGAVTWGSALTGISGWVSPTNSLVGTHTDDRVGLNGVLALPSGNYVIVSGYWANGAHLGAGAVTWGNGVTGATGSVSAANSLVGTSSNDHIGSFDYYVPAVTVLANGNYVVTSRYWDNGPISDAGAATWGSGASGVSGPVSAANSLVGSTTGDLVGSNLATPLPDGNYVLVSSAWDNGSAVDAGAVTWANGFTANTGPINAGNSLVGAANEDYLGVLQPLYLLGAVTALGDGKYWVESPHWGASPTEGAISLADGCSPLLGLVNTTNSILGTKDRGSVAYDPVYRQLAVGLPGSNQVMLWRGCDYVPPSTLTASVIILNDNGGVMQAGDIDLFLDGQPFPIVAETVVSPGAHVITQTNVAGYTGTFGGDCTADGHLTVNTGARAACSLLLNDQPATFVVRVVTIPSPDPTGTSFTFTAGGGVTPSRFNLAGGEERTFAGLSTQAGYSVAEAVPAGWQLDAAICTGGKSVADFALGLGEKVTCTFVNAQLDADREHLYLPLLHK